MALQRLTDKAAFAATLSLTDLIHIVDVSDITQNAAGSSFKLTLSQLKDFISTSIYISDGSLSANRTVTMNAKTLTFSSGGSSVANMAIGGALVANSRLTVQGFDATSSFYAAKFLNNSSLDLLAIRNDGNVGIGIGVPLVTLHIKSVLGQTSAISILENTIGKIQKFVSLAAPDGLITGSVSDECNDTVSGFKYIKRAGIATNLGWYKITNGTLPYKQIGATYTATNADVTLNCISGTFTVSIPAPESNFDELKVFIIKNSGIGTITVTGVSGQTFDLSTTITIFPGQSYSIQGDLGDNYIII